MSMVTRNQAIHKMVNEMKLRFSQPQLMHIQRFIHGIILSPGKRTVSNIRRTNLSEGDASCYTRFLKESPWNEEHLQEQRLKWLGKLLLKQKADTPSVGFLLLDDTCNAKDRSTRHIEGLDFHYSHSDGKSVWAHSVVSSHVVSQGYSFPWDFRVYRRKEDCASSNTPFRSKVELAMELVQSFAAADDKMYVMADSWYSSEKLISTCDQKGYFYIGALKLNAIVYPWGHRTSVSQLASALRPQDLRSVTVEGKRYDLYEYEGKVSRIDNAKVILSWEGGYDPKRTPFVLICTDISLDSETVLAYYGKRWNIETGYRYLKETQGFDQYQVRSMKAVRRFWMLQFLTYTYLEIRRHELRLGTLGDVIHRERMDYFGRLVIQAYQFGFQQVPLRQVLDEFGLSA